MPWKKSNRKRVPKRKVAKRSMMIKSRNQRVYNFKRSFYVSNYISSTSAADTPAAVSFALNGVPNAAEFTGLYDQYRINAIKLRLMPRGNSSELGPATGGGICSLFSVIDYDDASVPTGGVNQLVQYQSLKVTRSDREHVRYFKPRINVGAINSVAGGIQNKVNTKGWLDCDVSTTDHYGLKFVLERTPTGTCIYDAIVTMYMSFRNVR